MYPHIMRAFYTQIENICRTTGFIAGKSGRHMKYPYTFSAKIAQFPFFYYVKNNIIWMYWPPGVAVASYFIAQIHYVINSDANVRSWAETQRRIAEKEHEH